MTPATGTASAAPRIPQMLPKNTSAAIVVTGADPARRPGLVAAPRESELHCGGQGQREIFATGDM